MKTKILLTFIALTAFINSSFSQSNPTTFNLGGGNYSFTQWDAASAAGTYPASVKFHVHATADPLFVDEPTGDWVCLYNISSRSRIVGEGTAGVSFLNTSDTQDDQTRCGNGPNDVGGYLGEFVLALNAGGRNNITVSWLNTLVAQGNGVPLPREYGMRLQYRVGTSGVWANVPGANEFNSTGLINGATQNFGPIVLPAGCNNQPVVQLRWKYYMNAANDGGTRPRIGLDEITVTSDLVTGTEELMNANFLVVYPNPANGDQLFFSKKISATLVSVSGQIISEVKDSESLDIREVSEGIYFVKTAEGEAVKILVKK